MRPRKGRCGRQGQRRRRSPAINFGNETNSASSVGTRRSSKGVTLANKSSSSGHAEDMVFKRNASTPCFPGELAKRRGLVIPRFDKSCATVAAAAIALLLAACGSSDDKTAGRGGRGGPGGPAAVGYVVVQQGSAPLEQELPGRVAAYQVSEVRPQVSGVIQRRLFREGSVVRQGQTLYQIDPSVYNAQAAQAAANLQSARAQAEAARTLASRYRPLVQQQAISKQDYTNAVAQARQADASVAQNAAALRSAQINLRFTRVPAPITGRIGLSNMTEGALVTANQADPLDHDHPARPGLCRHPGIGGRPARPAARAQPGRRRPHVGAGSAEAPRRLLSMASPARSSSARCWWTRAPAPSRSAPASRTPSRCSCQACS